MAPHQIRKMTIRQLREIFLQMTSSEWDLALIGRPKTVIREASLQLLQVQRLRLRLVNEELANIRDRLLENEDELVAGSESVAKALENLKKVEKVLSTVQTFLSVIGRVVAIA